MSVPSNTVQVQATQVDPRRLGSPETYFGALRNQYLANGTRGRTGTQTFKAPAKYGLNQLYLGGTWDIQNEFARSQKDGKIFYHFKAKNVYFVARSAGGATIRVMIDGRTGSRAGQDVTSDGAAVIKEDRLYKVISLGDYGDHVLEIDATGGSVDAYTFTFG